MLPGLVLAALVGAAARARRGRRRARRGGRDRARRRTASGGDIGVAVVVSGLFGLGGILALSPETPPRLAELLFGDLLGITTGDLRRRRRCSAPARRCSRSAIASPEPRCRPRLRRAPERAAPDLALLAILAVTTVAAVQGLGNLLLIALILAPAAAALNLATRLPACSRIAAALAALAGVAGLVVSYELEIAAGRVIALVRCRDFSSLGLLKPKLAMP